MIPNNSKLKGAQQQGKINYDLRLAQLDKDLVVSQVTKMHEDIHRKICELRRCNSNICNDEILTTIANDKDLYVKRYTYIHDNFPVVFGSLMETVDYRIDILVKMINKLHEMSIRKAGGKQVRDDIANMLHKEFTNVPDNTEK